MTGPEHYLAAEQWLRWAEELYRASDHDDDALPGGQLAASIAQVHATLAHTAATGELDAYDAATGRSLSDAAAWREVLVDAPELHEPVRPS